MMKAITIASRSPTLMSSCSHAVGSSHSPALDISLLPQRWHKAQVVIVFIVLIAATFIITVGECGSSSQSVHPQHRAD